MGPVDLEARFRAEAPRLHRLDLGYFGRVEAAEDAVQKTFARALAAAAEFRDQADAGTWLYRIAVNICLDGVRGEQRHPVASLDAAGEIRGCPGTLKRVEERQIEEAVRRAVDQLRPKYRLLVVLCEFEGLSYKDISRATGLSVGTISSRLNRAKRQLSRELAHLA